MPALTEKAFEDHFCHQLEIADYKKHESSAVSDKQLCLNFTELEEFLGNTQPDELRLLKTELGQEWKTAITKAYSNELLTKKPFEILRDGFQVYTQHLRLAYFKPQTSFNEDEEKRYKQNRFS